ncbi:hypothetical protein EUTSA_v10029406mg [Eutrema salsugineum]|uniref:FKB95-like N-terminal Kelch domain-containing protein n=1 Tax=Eutrema salsugineum TaxID=72664 RepID=V4L8F4_EUTSA|nr:hypothetical protein EUTSA_v10029406mg [Eutrema salsugineum]
MISEEVEPTQKTIPCRPSSSFSSLPDEITENILARVSRWNYPSLCLPALGSEIYLFDIPHTEPSSSVQILDCRNHTWRDSPSMIATRKNVSALFSNQKIYTGPVDEYPATWFEVFDMTAFPAPGADDDKLRNLLSGTDNYGIVNAIDGKVYVEIDEKEFAYEPKDGTWELVREHLAVCEIKNVIYCFTISGELMWFDSKTECREWRRVKGLQKLREDSTMGINFAKEFDMINYGGKLLVMWDISGIKPKNKIRYAKIILESRCNGREVWGKVECVDELTFPCEAYESFYCFTVLV